ncbi:MAG: patatin-like phospholipase domain-containing protein [Chloroflexi bacterium]|nr:patatin-like phospholipase domain-containing protein [Chloroflexota bacterium]
MAHNLRKIPFFSDLEEDVLDAISRRLQREHYHKGATVFSEGETGDCMYILESGQVKIVTSNGGREKVLAYVGPGNFFGEMALLLDERRSATAQVVIDADLLVLYRDDLKDLLSLHSSIAVLMTRELGRRLGRSNRDREEREQLNVIAAMGSPLPTLARYLAQVTGETVCLFDLGGLANVTLHPSALAQDKLVLVRDEHSFGPEELPERLSSLVEQYYWVLLCIAPYETPLTLKAMELSDITVQIGAEEQAWTRHIAAKRLWRGDSSETSVRRIARRIAQRLVGLALSSGNARGFAHIGVLKVLQEENIPVDMIAGTSAGAVFGSMYAAGRSVPELIEFAINVQRQYNFFTGFRYWDIRVPPHSGLIKGNKVLSYFRKWLADKTFDDLNIPLYIVATDLISGEEVVFDRGPVAEAVRASMSVIGILEPAYVSGRFLIDGGSVNPVPTQLLADKGNSIILASNVIPSLEERIHRRELRREGRLPNVVGILMGAMEIMESEIIRSRMGPVDVLIQPDIARYGTLEYEKVRELIQRGEEAARAQIPAIKQLLAPHPRQPLRAL